MATTKNKNLFYQLYSTDSAVADSGYKCSSAIDESQTSFDISGSDGQITDSNGDVIASIDLSELHVDDITEYNVETKILQPHSAYLLQGNEYGETYKSQFFLIHHLISTVEGYAEYCNIKFDILYKLNGKKHNVHVDTKTVRTTYGSFVDIVQNQLNKLKANITVSIKEYDDQNSSVSVLDYINFQSTEEGYDFIIRNVIITPILADDENCNGETGQFEDSPFTDQIEITNDMLIDLLNKYKPRLIGETTTSETIYKIGCDIYRALMTLTNDITSDFNTFVYELDIIKKYFLPCFETDGTLIFPKRFYDVLVKKYPEIYQKYFTGTLSKYNIYDIYNILVEIKEYLFKAKNSSGPSYCLEDINRRINPIKYPNGAMKGIVIVPQWPDDEDYDTCVLWLNHVADKVEVCIPVSVEQLNQYFNGNVISNKRARLFEKSLATVQINAIIPTERQRYIEDEDNLPLNDISSNDGFSNSFDRLYVAGQDENDFINNQFHRVPIDQDKTTWEDGNRIKYHNPELYIDSNNDDENVWEDNPYKTDVHYVDTHENFTVKFIGLYKYMEYLSTNDLWLRIGDGYIITAKDDNFENNKIRNLLNSVLLYNPNDIPIKIKYMIFS